MQVSCFCLDWAEVTKRPTPQAILDEMICTDDIDRYAVHPPDSEWSDSAILHFEVARSLPHLVKDMPPDLRPHLEAVMSIISAGNSIDELGLSPLTDGCYFISISPATVDRLLRAFECLDLSDLGRRCGRLVTPGDREELPDIDRHLTHVLEQWRDALRFARERKLGLIGHCG